MTEAILDVDGQTAVFSFKQAFLKNKNTDTLLGTSKELSDINTDEFTSAISKILEEELKNPSKFVTHFFFSKICHGRFTKTIVKPFTKIVKEGIHQFVTETLKSRVLVTNNETIPTVSFPTV